MHLHHHISFGLALGALPGSSAFTASSNYWNSKNHPRAVVLRSSKLPSDVVASTLSLDDLKTDLVRCCTRKSKPLLDEVRSLVRDLEEKAELVSCCLFLIFFRMPFFLLGGTTCHRSHSGFLFSYPFLVFFPCV